MKMLRHPTFANPVTAPDILGTLEGLLAQLSAPPGARTARLVRAATDGKARKLVEEATELALGAVTANRAGMIAESVDPLCRPGVLWRGRATQTGRGDPCRAPFHPEEAP